MKKNNVKILIDLTMTLMLPMLMAYSLIGEKFHELVGTAMLALFIIHHILNGRWYKSIGKRKQNSAALFRTILNSILLVLTILQSLSGIVMSKYLYSFLQIKGISAYAREVHLMIAYWCYILCCIHAGTHLTALMYRMKTRNRKYWTSLLIVWILIGIYGIYAFFKRQFPQYMFHMILFAYFDFSEPRILFFLDYLSIMTVFALIGYLSIASLSIKKKEKKPI